MLLFLLLLLAVLPSLSNLPSSNPSSPLMRLIFSDPRMYEEELELLFLMLLLAMLLSLPNLRLLQSILITNEINCFRSQDV